VEIQQICSQNLDMGSTLKSQIEVFTKVFLTAELAQKMVNVRSDHAAELKRLIILIIINYYELAIQLLI
jgi:hypothetical protein